MRGNLIFLFCLYLQQWFNKHKLLMVQGQGSQVKLTGQFCVSAFLTSEYKITIVQDCSRFVSYLFFYKPVVYYFYAVNKIFMTFSCVF